jgi:putative spermidine/putrescine transport system substrate-binding protein
MGVQMKSPLTSRFSRRAALHAGAASLAALALPDIGWAQSSTITVRVYQGYFKTALEKDVLPKFTSLTGIAVKTVGDVTSANWLVELERAARVGVAAADVSMMSRSSTADGMKSGLWAAIDLAKIPYSKYVLPKYIIKYPDGRVAAVGASTWTTVDDTASWAVSKASRATAQTQAFIDYMCRPETQKQLITLLGVDPTVTV